MVKVMNNINIDITEGRNRLPSRDSPSLSSNSSSSSENSSHDFILYSQRQEWNDIKPLPQEDGPHPIVAIAYSERFRDTFDYFRAVLHKNELSERSLELTKDCVSLNPSNYTIWFFRRLIIKELNKDLFNELNYIESVIIDNAKNYQVWHHRKCIVEYIKQQILSKDFRAEGDMSDEREKELSEVVKGEKIFVSFMLRQDSKNYHGWQHRQWLIKEFNAWHLEIDYTQDLIEDDIRNNSAWNHRYYVIENTTGFIGEALESEIKFTCHRIRLTPNNESSWNYLRGILSSIGLNSNQLIVKMCEDLYKNRETRSSHLIAFMIDCIEECLSSQTKPDQNLLTEALRLCEELSNQIDVIRKEYWNFIARELQHNYKIDE